MAVGTSIAVVDDDPSVRKALSRLLRAARMTVATYASAEEFLVDFVVNLPDCLVLDVRMPGMTGPELRDHLTASGHRIPIVFITAHTEDVAVERVTSGDHVLILRKPIDDDALLEAIRRSERGSRPDAP